MNFKDTWFTAEQKALDLSKRPALKRFNEICVNVIHTVFLLLLCVLVFTFLLALAIVELGITKLNSLKKPVEEDQVTEVSEKDLYPQNTSEPEVIKKMRDAGQL